MKTSALVCRLRDASASAGLVLLALAACAPASLRYTLRIETEPAGAKIYDPRTDELVGTSPLEIPVQYACGKLGECTRLQTPFDAYSPQDTSARGRRVKLDTEDFVKLYVVADGYQKLGATVTWQVTPVDGQLIRKVIRLQPTVRESPEDVYH